MGEVINIESPKQHLEREVAELERRLGEAIEEDEFDDLELINVLKAELKEKQGELLKLNS